MSNPINQFIRQELYKLNHLHSDLCGNIGHLKSELICCSKMADDVSKQMDRVRALVDCCDDSTDLDEKWQKQ